MRTLRNCLFVLFGFVSVPVLVGCGPDCDAPESAQYSQGAITSGAGCAGFEPDSEKRYPLGTTVRLPHCLEAYPGAVATCTCNQSPVDTTAPYWACPM